MIITVTMNPAIDKTVEVGRLETGSLNRIQRVEYDAGGKGINVSKTIRELGGESIATGFLGGSAGKTIASVLKAKGIACDFVAVDGETRTNTKIFEASGAVTELNEPGPAIDSGKVEELLHKLEGYAGKDVLFVLSGSIPCGVDTGIYAEIIRRVREKGAVVMLDADGEPLRRGIAAGPDFVKPNRMELERYAGLPCGTAREELLRSARELIHGGICMVAVSMGKDGALFVRPGYEACCQALAVKAHSTVGAGDAMVAALAYAWSRALGDDDTVRLCMAASAGAVTTTGTKPPAKELVETLMRQVEIERL